MEPTSYCGASFGHVHCENFVLNEEDPLKLFQRNEIDEDTFWLDLKNCSGVIDSKTFALLPKLEILNLIGCKIEKVANNSFGNLNELKSIDVRESSFPVDTDSFNKCKLKSVYLSDLKINIGKLSNLKFLEDITFINCTFSVISKAAFTNFSLLNSLTFSSCQINKIDSDAFEDLEHLTELRITECNLEYLDSNCFSKLTSLKYLSFHANSVNSSINYEVFQNLPSLENILFDLNIYKNLNFEKYANLKTVQIGYDEEKVEKELRNSIISMLTEKKIHHELVFTGKVAVDMNEVQICA